MERSFQEYGGSLKTVTSFKYLVPVLMAWDDNWPYVAGNLKKSRKNWTRMTRILVWEGADPRISGLFLKADVQAVLIFGSDIGVPTPRFGRALESFQHRFAWRITGRQPIIREEEGWEYPPLALEMEEAGFDEIRVYILNRQNMVSQYIATQPIMDLCKR